MQKVREGQFREDLYYRLRQVTIMVPPLSDRREDIPALANHFLTQVIREENLTPRVFSPAAIEALQAHSWPGNVRDLAGVIRNAAILAEGNEIGPQHLELEQATRTVHNLDILYEHQKVGRTGVTADDVFGRMYGDVALDYVLRRAQNEAGNLRSAGVLLGFLKPDCSDAEFNAFRQRVWRLRQRLANRNAAPARPVDPNGLHDKM
jgi:DNA-binding NtrC family response regulator